MPGEDVSADAIDAARSAGRDAAEATAATAPEHPLLGVGWAQGFGQIDQLRTAVQRARDAGFTWKQIAEVTGEHWQTARTKYGAGYEAQRRYRERKKAEGE